MKQPIARNQSLQDKSNVIEFDDHSAAAQPNLLDFSFLLGLTDALKEYEISFKQYFLLSRLLESGPMTMKEIADTLSVKDAAITGLIDRLGDERVNRPEKPSMGYVHRVPSTTDRRKVMVQITPVGAQVVFAIRRITQHLIADSLAADCDGDPRLSVVRDMVEAG